MSVNITQIFQQLDPKGLPAKQSIDTVRFAQQDMFFHLASAKSNRANRLKASFAEVGFSRVILSANINAFDCQLPGCTVEYLEKGFFEESSDEVQVQKRAHLARAIVIVNNNDVGQNMAAYADFYIQCEQTIFVAWDWDNHHWLDLSTFFSAHSDIYAPAHHENLYLLSRYNWATVGPVYCSTVQWSRQFLADSLPEMITASRSNEPLGKHIPYAPFVFRNRVVTTLSQSYPAIGFSDRNFHARTAQERLQEWMSHKVHWIVPVLNDVAIRIFDALISGGIPILPESMRFLPPVNSVHRDYIVFCKPEDIINPRPLVDRTNALFDKGGPDQIVARHRFAMDHHHGDKSVQDLHTTVVEMFSA
jgi:hypothetical protein